VDIDLTYIPLEDRQTSISNINAHLKAISDRAKRSLKAYTLYQILRPVNFYVNTEGSKSR
ncbi:MAG: hypothetical protein WC446_05715, partial [Candidatus Paceibacterota bacterium]